MKLQLSLKEQLKAEVEVTGFKNWREGMLAGYLLDEENSIVEAPYAENKYLLTGWYDGEFLYVYLLWEDGEQPLIERIEHERTP